MVVGVDDAGDDRKTGEVKIGILRSVFPDSGDFSFFVCLDTPGDDLSRENDPVTVNDHSIVNSFTAFLHCTAEETGLSFRMPAYHNAF